MYEVKKNEAWQLIGELKNFSFEESSGFQSGKLSGVEVLKTFWHSEVEIPMLVATKHDIAPELGKTTLGFIAHRLSGAKGDYHFSLRSSEERSLRYMPDYLYTALSKKERKNIKNLLRAEQETLTEAQSMTFDITTDDPRTIDVGHSYDLLVDGDVIHEITDMDVLLSPKSEITIPVDESYYKKPRMYVAERIMHEKFKDEVEQIENDLAFEAIVDPDDVGVYEPIVPYRDAAARMRNIILQMRANR